MGEELKSAAIVAFDAAIQTILVALGGAYVNRKKVSCTQYINAESTAAMNKVTVNFMLPCLIFYQVISSLNFDKLKIPILICLFVAIHVAMGITLGQLIGKITGASRDITDLMATAIAHTQATAIPLYYAEVLGNRPITNPDPDFEVLGPSYVLIFAVIMIFSNWTVSYRILWRPPCKRPLLEHVDANSDSSEGEDLYIAPSIMSQIANIFNPPAIAMFVALPFAVLTPVKNFLFLDKDAIFHDNLYAAVVRVGGCTSVLIMLALGSTLARGYPPSCDITKTQLGLCLLSKLVIIPSVGLGMFYGLYTWGIIVIDT
mmetsp:Transcript_34611/g.60863  ORF Transcript_34611/g.60863 Transcript_34611/m.60863 type:complete len:316 (+) Transcript_34611:37-984(+)